MVVGVGPQEAATKVEAQLTEMAMDLAERYMRLPGVVGFVIGGSLARGFVDEHSDLEAYCYYLGQLPSKAAIQEILDDLAAVTVRSPNLHWSHPAWGTHTFFRARDATVELGYRQMGEVAKKLEAYLSAGCIHTAMGDHDVPFGHYPSGLAACLADCRIVAERDTEVTRLKEHARRVPPALRETLLDFHIPEARGILRNKLTVAHCRADLLHFHAALARVVRSIVVAIFTLNGRHFPGDKWNANYLRDMAVLPRRFLADLAELFDRRLTCEEDRRRMLEIARSWVAWLESARPITGV